MYKDKEKQREANRLAKRRQRQGMTQVSKGMTLKAELAKRYPNLTVMERLFYRPASKLGSGETNFVSLPGRSCYGVYS